MHPNHAIEVPTPPPLQTCALAHGKLSFRQQGHGPTVVFLHGLLGNSKSWAFQFAGLSGSFRMVAWDAPGFGLSDQVPAEINIYVEALREFIESLDSGPVHLVGHSMGGTLAARYAALHPDRIRKLVLSCTHPGYGEPETAPMSEKFENRMREYAEIGAWLYGERRARDLLPADCPAPIVAFAAEVAGEVRPDGLRNATRPSIFSNPLASITRPRSSPRFLLRKISASIAKVISLTFAVARMCPPPANSRFSS